MDMNQFATAWAEYVKSLNGSPISVDDVIDFCNIHTTSMEEHTAMYDLLFDQIEVGLYPDDDASDWLTDEDWDECGFDPYAGCYTYDC